MFIRITAFIMAFIWLFAPLGVLAGEAFFTKKDGCPVPDAGAAVLMEKDSGEILYSHNANTRLPMASTTKIMTAILVSELLPLDRMVVVPNEAAGCEGSSIYLYKGEKITVEELLYGLLLESANDAAVTLAIEAAGSVEAFAGLMNKKAKEMGLKDTNFVNPHGLDHSEHYTTASDLAVIAAHALSDPIVSRVAATKVYKSEKRVMSNHNRLLSTYKGAIGLKTGYTMRCGRCLVSGAQRDGMTLIAVTLNCRNDWRAHSSMLDWGFDNYQRSVINEGAGFTCITLVTGGQCDTVQLKSSGNISFLMDKGEYNIRTQTKVKRLVFAPVKEGEKLGEVDIYVDDQLYATVDLLAVQDVLIRENEVKSGFFTRIIRFITDLFN